MYEMKGSVLNPVNCFEIYIPKLHPENPFLFQKPKRKLSVQESVWFTKEVIGKNTIC